MIMEWWPEMPLILGRSGTQYFANRPRSIHQYSNMAPRLSGQTSIFGVVFFVSKSRLGIEGQRKLEKFAILTRRTRSHARILTYRTWPIGNKTVKLILWSRFSRILRQRIKHFLFKLAEISFFII